MIEAIVFWFACREAIQTDEETFLVRDADAFLVVEVFGNQPSGVAELVPSDVVAVVEFARWFPVGAVGVDEEKPAQVFHGQHLVFLDMYAQVLHQCPQPVEHKEVRCGVQTVGGHVFILALSLRLAGVVGNNAAVLLLLVVAVFLVAQGDVAIGMGGRAVLVFGIGLVGVDAVWREAGARIIRVTSEHFELSVGEYHARVLLSRVVLVVAVKYQDLTVRTCYRTFFSRILVGKDALCL